MRFLELCETLRQGSIQAWTHYDLPRQARLPEELPIFTYKEVSDVTDAWEKQPADERVAVLLRQIETSGRIDVDRARAFWNLLMKVRDLHLGGVAEHELESDVKAGLKTASEMTAIARLIAIEKGGFRNGNLGAEEWASCFQAIARWAHFRSLDYYDAVRTEERELVRDIFRELPMALKAQLYPSFSQNHPRGPDPGREFWELLQQIQTGAAVAAVEIVLDLFRRPQRVETLWVGDYGTPPKAVLFSKDSPLYSDQSQKSRLLEIAGEATKNQVIHRNFLPLFRQLAHGAQQGGSFSMQDCRAILADGTLLQAVWTAAVAFPLNPRVAGSLREQRSAIAGRLATEDNMPLPRWWKDLEQAGFFKS